jgi:hypothetical protein
MRRGQEVELYSGIIDVKTFENERLRVHHHRLGRDTR